jgi:hypothetical protein
MPMRGPDPTPIDSTPRAVRPIRSRPTHGHCGSGSSPSVGYRTIRGVAVEAVIRRGRLRGIKGAHRRKAGRHVVPAAGGPRGLPAHRYRCRALRVVIPVSPPQFSTLGIVGAGTALTKSRYSWLIRHTMIKQVPNFVILDGRLPATRRAVAAMIKLYEVAGRGVPQSLLYSSTLELGETTTRIVQTMERSQAKRVFLDSLSEIRLLAQSSLRYRRQILALKHYFGRRDATVVLLDDMTAESGTRGAAS